jgi:hypothetical protein
MAAVLFRMVDVPFVLEDTEEGEDRIVGEIQTPFGQRITHL